MLKKQYALLFSVLFTSLLTYFSLREVNQLPSNIIANLDKVLHIIAYILLTVTWAVTLFKYNIINILTIVYIGLLSYGILIEVLQSEITETRIFEIHDVFANILGMALGSLIFKFVIASKLKNN